MLNKYLENDPVFAGSSPMSLADLLQVSLPWLVSVSHKWRCPSELAPDMLLLLLLTLVLSGLIDFPVFADHPSHEVSQAISSSQNSLQPLLPIGHLWSDATWPLKLLLPLCSVSDSEFNTKLSNPDTWESPSILPSLHTHSLEPFTSHIQSLGSVGSFPKSLWNLSYSSVLIQVNISSGFFQQPLHWSSFLAPSHPPAKAPSTPPLCSCTCYSDGLSPG